MRIATALILAVVAAGQTADQRARVDKIFAGFNTNTPGCSVGVNHNGAAVFRGGYGMADLERRVAITAGTVFESGSVAKQFTAAALHLLAQQGVISLDDPMRKYLTELPAYGAPLTIRQVISHTSGLREWRPLATFGGMPEGKFVYTNGDLLRMASKQRAVNFDPGSAYSYSNTGYNVATILIERALGGQKTFQEYTREVIFAPLGMTHSRWRDDFRAIVPNRALAYAREGGAGWKQATPIENIIGAGGLLTTVGDLLLWNENFTHAKVGGEAFVKAQQTPAVLTGGKTIPYAAGLTLTRSGGLSEVSHGGATGGYRTWLGRYPEKQVSVAVLCNAADANPTNLARAVARIWTGGAAEAKPVSTHKVAPAMLEGMAGLYRSLRNNTAEELTAGEGRLRIRAVEYFPAGDARYVSASGSELRVEAARVTLRTTLGEETFEKVERAHPTPADLGALTGSYRSEETGGTVLVATNGRGELTYRVGESAAQTLRPTYRDGFEQGATAFRFLRDGSAVVSGLTIGDARVWDLRFARVR